MMKLQSPPIHPEAVRSADAETLRRFELALDHAPDGDVATRARLKVALRLRRLELSR